MSRRYNINPKRHRCYCSSSSPIMRFDESVTRFEGRYGSANELTEHLEDVSVTANESHGFQSDPIFRMDTNLPAGDVHMMVLSESESKFVNRRAALIRIWPYVGGAALLMLTILGGYLVLVNPLLINPFHVMTQIEANAIPESTLLIMASIMPVTMLLLLLVTVVMILYVFAAFSNERKLIAVVNRLLQ